MISVEKAKEIYEKAQELGISYDIILFYENIKEQDYREALSKYFDTLPKEEITFGWDEPEPDQYICWQGTQIPRWLL